MKYLREKRTIGLTGVRDKRNVSVRRNKNENERENKMLNQNTLSDLENTLSLYSDVYKDIHGIRPRWMRSDTITLAQAEAELESLLEYSSSLAAYEAELAENAAFEARLMDVSLDGSLEKYEVMAEGLGY